MAQPTPYVRQYDFVDWQTDNPSDPLPASSVEQELDAVKTTLDETLTNLALIQRDDGDLANNSVTTQQLAADVLALLNLDTTNVRGEWVTATAYAVNDIVVKDDSTYICAVAHTSGTFSTDLTAVKWVLLAAYVDPNVSIPAGSVGTTEIADNAVTLAKMADNSVGTAEIVDANVTTAKLATNAVTTAKITDANVTAVKLASDAVTTAKILDANVTTAKIADANVTWGKLAAGIFNQTAIAPASGDKVVFADASDSGNSKVATISDILALVPAGSGEANTSSNVGTGAQVAKAKSGVDLPFRSIKAGTVTLTRSGPLGLDAVKNLVSGTITVTQNTNDVTLSLEIVYTNQQAGAGT